MKRSFLPAFLALVLMVAVRTPLVLGQANFFVPPGGIGTWNATTNWSLGHLPQTGETAIIQSGRQATIDIANPSTFSFLRIADNDTAAVDGTLNILPGASLSVANQVLLAAGGPSNNFGVINQSGGSLTVNDALFIAFDVSHSANYNLSGGNVTTGNLWFRFGNGTLTQTGGTMNAQQLVLDEGGNPFTSALYDLQGGQFNVAAAANIGKPPGAGDPFAGSSLGSMNISGGIATFGSLLFGTDPTDQIHMFASGILRVNQTNYSTTNAQSDISSGKITGIGLVVSTVTVGNDTYTQINSVPEPTTLSIALFGAAIGLAFRGRLKRAEKGVEQI
jgi:hypothetical protein